MKKKENRKNGRSMAKITISIPDNVYKQMKQYPEINWNNTIQYKMRLLKNSRFFD
jgi:hypothetical protein